MTTGFTSLGFPSHRASRINCGYSRGSVLTRMFTALLLATLMALLAGRAKAQPTITGYNPAQNQKSASVGSPIVLTFSQTMNAGTASNAVFKTFGSYRGYLSGTGSYSGSGTGTITYTPATQYKAGEKISTTITSAAQSTAAVPIAKPYVYEFTARAGAGPGTFVTISTHPTGTNTQCVTFGDVDGDGDLDMVVVNFTGSLVSVFFNNGTGSFGAAVTYPAGTNSSFVTLGDIDGDGNLDMIVTNYGSANASVRFNIGAGAFGPLTNYPVGGASTGVALGDVNGDGYLDMVVSRQSGGVGVLLNTGSGTFNPVVGYGAGSNPWNVQLGDIDNDGDLDIAVANQGSANVSVLLNTGLGTFPSAANYGVAGGGPVRLTLGDITGDGYLDMAVVDNSNIAKVLTNTGAGAFAAFVPYSLGASGFGDQIQFGDVNGDGNLDLVVGNGGPSTNVSVFLNSGAGVFAPFVAFGAGVGDKGLALGDIDGDGDLDIAAGNPFAGGFVSVLKNALPQNVQNNVNPFTAAVPVAPARNTNTGALSGALTIPFAQPLNPASVNATGFKVFGNFTGLRTASYGSAGATATVTPTLPFRSGEEVFVTVTNAQSAAPNLIPTRPFVYGFRARAGVGPATFYSAPTLSPGGASTWSVCMGDFNGDGALDLASANGLTNNVSIFVNTGTGSFAAPTTVGSGGTDARYVIARDFNGDGKLDLAVANFTSNQLGILLGNGMGGFAGAVSYTTTAGGASVVDAGDIDGDGDLDIVVAGQTTGAYILFNNGSGIFSAPTFYAVGTNGPGVVFGDFDNDGDLDFAVANLIGNNVSIRFNNGLGTFGGANTYPVTQAAAITTGDFDGDGDLDLVVTNWGSANISILINNGVGSGTFAAAVTYPAGGANVNSAGDVDGDGDLDLIAPNTGTGTVSVLINLGAGTFGAASTYPSGGGGAFTQQAVVGDIDGDGDLDIAAANIASNNITLLYNMPPPTAYYYRSGNAALPASWYSSPVGGIPATTFSTPGLDFIVMGGSSAVTTTTATATSALNIPVGINFRIQAPSALAMGSGVLLNNLGNLIVEGNAGSSGTLLFNATLNFAGNVPTYQSNSTLQYAGIGNISTGNELPATMIGNVRASNIGTLTLAPAGNPVINGSVTIDQATTLQLNAGTTTTFNGALNLNGTLAHYPSGGLRSLILNGALALNGVIKQSLASNSAVTIGGTGAVTGTLRSLDNTWKSTLNLNRPGTRLRLGGPLLMNPATQQAIFLAADSCIIQTDSVNILTLSAANADISTAFTTSYIDGPLQRYVAPNSAAATVAFPIGKNGQALHAILQNLATGGNSPLLRAEAFTGATGGRTDGATVGSLDSAQYWNINLLSGNVVSSNVQFSRVQPIPAGSIIAKSPTQTGVFARLSGGTVAQAGVFSTITTGAFSSFSTFALGTPYIPPPFVPSITGFSPLQTTSGTTTSGTSIVLRGANFTNVQRVSIGGVQVQSFTVDSTNQVTIIVPNGIPSGAITIQTALGTATSAFPLTIIGAPTVTGVSPSVVGAGTQVIITGTNFIPAPAGNASGAIPVWVQLGGVTASSVSVLSPTQIIATFPLGAGGQALSGQPIVQAWGGSGVATQALTVIPPPIVNGFTPSTLASGDVLTVTGANFVQPMTVRIGNLVLNVTVNSPTRATIVLPQGQAQSQSAALTVSTPGGTATAGTVSIIGQPAISSQSLVTASPGETVTISGVNLTTVQSVLFGTTPASFHTDAQGRIIAIVPANLPPNTPLSLTVQTLGGTATAPQAFTPRPVQGVVITGISPLVADEGASIDIAGINFPTNATFTITIGGVAVTQVVVHSSTSLTVTLPAGLLSLTALSSSANVIITTPEGTAIAAVPISIRALNSPSLTSISDVSGGTNSTLTIAGANFGTAPRGGVLGVFVGGVPVGSFRVVSPTQIVIEPLGTVTSGAVTVLTSAGTLTLTQGGMLGLPIQFRFVPTLQPYMSVQASDSLALAALYQATGGSAWRDGTNWLTEAVSSWRGVRVADGRVVELRLPSNGLQGVLPSEALRALTGLRTLDLSNNAVQLDVTNVFSALPALETIRLAGNALTGSLAGICSLAKLKELDVSSCGLSGTLDVFCCANSIVTLSIANNNFSGAIPACLGDKQFLTSFDASNNQLFGALPAAFGNAPSLQSLNVRSNRLSGTIPSAWGEGANADKRTAQVTALSSLQRLDLSQNQLSGAIPASLGKLRNLRELRLADNRFTGNIPDAVTELLILTVLDVRNNQLSGAPSLNVIPRLDTLRMEGNRFGFAALEALASVRNFTYAPQSITPPHLADTSAVIDAPFALWATLAGANNRYQWRKNSVPVPQAPSDDAIKFIAFAPSDTGEYVCEISNTKLPLLTVSTASAHVQAVMPTSVPDTVALIAPSPAETDVPTLPLFVWRSADGAGQYRVEISTTPNFSSLPITLTIAQTAIALASGRVELDTRGLNGFPLLNETRYFWRVRAENARGEGGWTSSNFTTAANNTLGAMRLDFGKVPRRDTAFGMLTVRNLASTKVRLAGEITTSNPAFVCESLGNVEIPAESSLQVRVRFVPTVLETVSAALTVRFTAEGSTVVQTQTIANRLLGRGGALKLIPPPPDTSVIGTTKLLAVQVVNVGDREAEIIRLERRKGAREYSFRADVDGRAFIGVGDTTAVLLRFTAERINAASIEEIYCQATVDTVTKPLVEYGRAKLPTDVVAKIGLRAVPENASPGSEVMVEIYLDGLSDDDRVRLFKSSIPNFSVTLRFNRNALALGATSSARPIRNAALNNSSQRCAVPTTFWNGTSAVLLRIPCRAVAGNTDATALVLEDLKWGDGTLQIADVVEGRFTAKTSQAGGKRFISGASAGTGIVAVGIAPNPARDVLEVAYSLAKSGFVTISLLDVRGQEVGTFLNQVQPKGTHTLPVRVERFASGSYTLRLSIDAEEVYTQQVQVVR